jgi:hypothetical protein
MLKMENQSSPIESLLDRAKDYFETRLDLLKLKAVDKTSTIVSTFIAKTAIILLVFFFIFFLNIGIALLIGDLLGKSYYGFFIVAGIYGITGLVLHLGKEKIIKRPISDAIIKHMVD